MRRLTAIATLVAFGIGFVYGVRFANGMHQSSLEQLSFDIEFGELVGSYYAQA